MMKFWKMLNNKKTTIGSTLLLSAIIIEKMASIWISDTPPDWIPNLIVTLEWFGSLLTGVGLGHKGIKAASNQDPRISS